MNTPKKQYWVELYWPEKNRDLSSFFVWFNDKKLKKMKSMTKGDRVLFYEVGRHPENNIQGSKTIFASGTVLDKVDKITPNQQMRGGKRWLYKKEVKPDYVVMPQNGVPLKEIKDILDKKGWVQSGFQMTDVKKFGKIEEVLKLKSDFGTKTSRGLTLELGKVLSNAQLCTIFKCSTQGGMRRSKKTNTLVIISDQVKSIYEDMWYGDVLHYTGMGQKGNQSIDFAQNRTLKESKKNGINIHLFEVLNPGEYTYQGRVELVEKPYRTKQPDLNKRARDVWMFPLKVIGGRPIINEAVVRQKRDRRAKKAKKTKTKDLLGRLKNAPKRAGERAVTTKQYERNQDVVEYVKRRAKGVCELCEQKAPFLGRSGEPFLEAHHIVWLARNGDDTIENAVAICPNCHRKMHNLDKNSDKEILFKKAKLQGN